MRQLVKNKKEACGKTEVTADFSSINPIKQTLWKMEMDITQHWRKKKSIPREVNCMVINPLYVTMKLATGQSHGSHQSYSCPLNIFP
jgi:hypothetical protein